MRVFACNVVSNCNEIGALLSEIGGPERTGRYVFIYIDLAQATLQFRGSLLR
jgi:hypothetical protein